jgi:regulator of RNase E activity RraA
MRSTQALTLTSLLFCIGSLWTTAVSAQVPFDQDFGADVVAPDGFRTNRTSFSAIMEVLAPSRPEVTQEQLDQLRAIPLEAIFAAVGEYRTNYARGFANTRPGERLVGRALTMRFLPPRPDLVRAANVLAEEGNWDRRYYARASEEAQPGDVVVAELGGSDGHNLFGDMGATGIQMRGAAGVVIDGGTRDLIGLQDDRFEDFPVLHRFSDTHTTSWLGVEYNAPVRIGGVTVLPGDIVVGDDGGVFFFPPELVDKVLEYAAESEAREAFQLQQLLDKNFRFRDIYPLSPPLVEEFERTR